MSILLQERMGDRALRCCTKCGQWKDPKTDFLLRRCRFRTRQGVKICIYLAAECRSCNAQRAAKWREQKKASGELAMHQARWESRRDRKHQRRVQREWYRATRAENLHHIWKKYVHELENPPSHPEFDALLVSAFIDRFLVTTLISETFDSDEDGSEWGLGRKTRSKTCHVYKINGVKLTDVETHQLSRWRRGVTKRISIEQADKWATRFDLPLWEIEEAGRIAA